MAGHMPEGRQVHACIPQVPDTRVPYIARRERLRTCLPRPLLEDPVHGLRGHPPIRDATPLRPEDKRAGPLVHRVSYVPGERRQAQQGGAQGVHAQAARRPQLDAQTPDRLAAEPRLRGTFCTMRRYIGGLSSWGSS